jgi:hypothetical protein
MDKNNVILLKNYEAWYQILELDLVTGKKQVFERQADVKIRGAYVERDQTLLLFYKKDGKLHFACGGRGVCLEDCEITFERLGKDNRFRISLHGESFFEHTYPSWREDPLNKVDIDFNEDMEENQDFFLFIHNVMQDSEWAARIYPE